MYLQSLASAFPENVFTQRECWDFLSSGRGLDGLKPRSRELMEKILLGDSGISTRRFACADLEAVFQLDAGGLHRAFAAAAPVLAGRALSRALERAGLVAANIDALFICTCTGYLCPGLSSYVAERLGGRSSRSQSAVVQPPVMPVPG